MRWAWGAMRMRWRSEKAGDGLLVFAKSVGVVWGSTYTAVARVLKRAATPRSSSHFPVVVCVKS